LVKRLGADEVIDYANSSWKEDCVRLRNYDLVVDCVGLDDYWEVFGRQVCEYVCSYTYIRI
jgi:NADPH:quinone reductase-like Zn-dependent oxidoreductase